MNMVEFRITEPARQSEGILEIGRRMRVTCLEGDRFLVAEEALRVLDRLGVPYIVLAREPFNYERHALSHIAASKFPDRQPVPAKYITEIQIELAGRCGGATLEPGRVSGMWMDEGQLVEDELLKLVDRCEIALTCGRTCHSSGNGFNTVSARKLFTSPPNESRCADIQSLINSVSLWRRTRREQLDANKLLISSLDIVPKGVIREPSMAPKTKVAEQKPL